MPLGSLRKTTHGARRASSRHMAARWLAAIWLGTSVAAAEPGAAHFTLISSGDRASVVVDLDQEVVVAAIEATDNLSVNVEIGPVKGKVVNEDLDAAQRSPLVRQVRVRGVTLGRGGTLLSIRIIGKSPISGSIRQAHGRVYIDLEPLVTTAIARQAFGGASRPAASTPSPEGPSSGTSPAAVETSRERRMDDAAPRGAAPTVATTAEPPAATATQAAQTSNAQARSNRESDDRILESAEQMARALDVKGLERLTSKPIASLVLAAKLDQLLADARERRIKADHRGPREGNLSAAPAGSPNQSPVAVPPRIEAPTRSAAVAPAPAATRPQAPPERQPTAAASSPAVEPSRPDTARPYGQRSANPRAFRQGMRSLKPELEALTGTMSVLSPGSVLAGELAIQMESMLARLQALDPPNELGSSHKRACSALSKLLDGWVKAPDGELVIAVSADPAILENSRSAMRDYLNEFDSFDTQSASPVQRD